MLAARALAAPAPSDLPASVDELDASDPADDIDEEVARSALDAGASVVEDSLAATSGLVDVTSLHDLEARHHRPSPWGRVDLVLAWRRIDRTHDTAEAALSSMREPSRRDEVWLVATWRN